MTSTTVYDPVHFGAVADGQTLCTNAIQKAIDESAADGGGTVRLAGGSFLTGTLFMRSRVTLEIAQNSVLLGSTDLQDYPTTIPACRSYADAYTEKCLIYAESEHDIAIKGQGTIDGQGASFSGDYKLRPYGIRFVTCEDICVQDVTLRNSAMWMQHYLACDRVTLRGITVWNHVNRNNDMVDIDGCRDVLITDCIGDSDDDGITLKSSCDRLCENVTVKNCTLSSHCSAIKCGSETNGGFKNIQISDCTIRPSGSSNPVNGYRDGWTGISLEIVDGGQMEDVTIRNIDIENAAAPLFIRLGDRGRPFHKDQPRPNVGTVRNITLGDIKARGANSMGCVVAGLESHPIENLTLANLDFAFTGGGTRQDVIRTFDEMPEAYPESVMFTQQTIGPIEEGPPPAQTFRLRGQTYRFGRLPAYGIFFWHVKGLNIQNTRLTTGVPDERPSIVLEDAVDVAIDQRQVDAPSDAPEGVLVVG